MKHLYPHLHPTVGYALVLKVPYPGTTTTRVHGLGLICSHHSATTPFIGLLVFLPIWKDSKRAHDGDLTIEFMINGKRTDKKIGEGFT